MNDIPRIIQGRIEEFSNKFPRFVSERLKAFLSDTQNIQTLGLWAASIVAALISVGYAKLFRYSEKVFQLILIKHHYWVLLVSPLFFLLAWYLVRRFSPEASGSGIPQIMAANEMEYSGEKRSFVDKLLSLRTAVVKILSSLLCVVGGGAIGREGPTLQICASIFHFFGQRVRKFLPGTHEHLWVVAGAAAGLASAFNTPLGGIVYAIEELGLVHFHRIRSALLSGVIVSGLVAQSLLGSYLYLGFPSLNPASFSFVPAAMLNGIVAGIAGAMFGKILLIFLKKRLQIKNFSKLAVVTCGCGIVIAGLSLYEPLISGPGTPVINRLLFKDEHAGPALILIRYFGTIISYLSGAAGGIFSPSLSIGATIGSYLTNFFGQTHPHLMILLGMIGFLTGVTRTPFTSFILVLEMTDRHSAIFPMMVTALTAQWIANLIDHKSFYEHVKNRYIESFRDGQISDRST